MAEDAATKIRRGVFRFHRQPIWRAEFARDRARDGRDGRVHSWLPKSPVAVVPRSYNIKAGVRIHPLATMTIPLTFISQYPGVSWLLFSLPRIVAPAFIVYTFISSSLGLFVGWDSLDGSRWKVAVASALTFPSVFICSITWNRLKTAYRARKLGAITPPVIAGKLPGSFDIVWSAAKARFTAYPGEQTLTVVAFSVVPGPQLPLAIGFDIIANLTPAHQLVSDVI